MSATTCPWPPAPTIRTRFSLIGTFTEFDNPSATRSYSNHQGQPAHHNPCIIQGWPRSCLGCVRYGTKCFAVETRFCSLGLVCRWDWRFPLSTSQEPERGN